jgi:hypothetical protein
MALSRIWVSGRDAQRGPRTGATSDGDHPGAVAWATSALSYDDTTVSALARHLGLAWHTAWHAIESEAKARTSDPDRLKD